jgi:methyltransferase (TIGR00027 family)
MREGVPSATAQGAAEGRAAHQLIDRPVVFEDPLALPILGKSGASKLHAEIGEHQTPFRRALRGQFVGRSRYAENRLAAAVRRDVRQYLVLGAGLDTYACRNPDGAVTVFEVDHPATQAWKRERLAEAGLAVPACLRFAAADFAAQAPGAALDAALAGTGFDAGQPAFVACLGVSYYLPREALDATLRWTAALASGSELVLDFMPPPEQHSEQARAALRRLAATVASQGEPLRSFFAPAEMAGRARAAGFAETEPVAAAAIDAVHFEPLGSEMRMRGYMLRAAL